MVVCNWAVGSCSRINTAAWGGGSLSYCFLLSLAFVVFAMGRGIHKKFIFSEGRRRSSNSAQPTTRAACAAMAQAGAGAGPLWLVSSAGWKQLVGPPAPGVDCVSPLVSFKSPSTPIGRVPPSVSPKIGTPSCAELGHHGGRRGALQDRTPNRRRRMRRRRPLLFLLLAQLH